MTQVSASWKPDGRHSRRLLSRVRAILRKHTDALDPVQLAYTDAFPNPAAISTELGPEGVAELFMEIAGVADERALREREGCTDHDLLDDYWREMSRLASLIPWLARRYPVPVLAGLAHPNRAVRLHVAGAIERVPFRPAPRRCDGRSSGSRTIRRAA